MERGAERARRGAWRRGALAAELVLCGAAAACAGAKGAARRWALARPDGTCGGRRGKAMTRLFDEHVIRPVVSLDGLWDFVPETEVTERDAAGLPTEFPYRLGVPGCWEMHPKWRSHRGKGWFRVIMIQPTGGPLRLMFKGVSHTARVLVDREEAGGHYNAYTAFEVVLPHVEEGEHEVLVEVDNTFGAHSALHVENDYYTYGGLVRPVAAEHPSAQYVRRLHFTPRMGKGGKGWTASLEMEVRNVAGSAAAVRGEVIVAGQVVDLGGATVAAGASVRLGAEAALEDVSAWSPESPHLYYAYAFLYGEDPEEPMDDLVDRVGFRQVETRGTEILLNGEAVRLRGFNRHEDHPVFGCAIPVEAMLHDVYHVEHLGANFIRTSHYPNDERWLDLCDERGLMVWEENHARGLTGERFRHPKFREQSLACTREMVEQHYNHASIVLWGILNECESFTEEGKAVYAEHFELIKGMDASRPTTFASCHGFKDVSLDLPDVVGFNLYTGWYRGSLGEIPVRVDEIIAWIEKAGGGGKPLILSEFGGGAIPGYRSDARVKWSEERQADILDACLGCYLNHRRIAGAAIWQFCDCRVTEGWATSRPRTMNNKGVVDEYRRPKLSYEVVRRRFREAWGGGE